MEEGNVGDLLKTLGNFEAIHKCSFFTGSAEQGMKVQATPGAFKHGDDGDGIYGRRGK